MRTTEELLYVEAIIDISSKRTVSDYQSVNVKILDKFDHDRYYMVRTFQGAVYAIYANSIKKIISKEQYEK